MKDANIVLFKQYLKHCSSNTSCIARHVVHHDLMWLISYSPLHRDVCILLWWRHSQQRMYPSHRYPSPLPLTTPTPLKVAILSCKIMITNCHTTPCVSCIGETITFEGLWNYYHNFCWEQQVICEFLNCDWVHYKWHHLLYYYIVFNIQWVTFTCDVYR